MKQFFSLVRSIGFVGLALAAGTAAMDATAQAYPSKPIRIVVGFPPGGGADVLARVISAPLAEELKATIIVENKPGAGGIIATEATAKAPPDGYTLYIATPGSFTIWPNMQKLGYDPGKDFHYISRLVIMPNVLVVSPGAGITSVKDLIAKAKAEPDKINYASGGIGTIGQIAGEQFNMLAGVKMRHIAYKGTTPALTDVMGGVVPLTFSDPSVKTLIDGGKLKGIAVTTAQRSPLFPNLPTVAESGMPGYEVMNWYGLVGPAGLPSEVSTKLSAALAKVMAMKEVKDKLAANGMEATYETPAQFADFRSKERAKWGELITRAGIKAE